jgi:uncharacterized protein YkwD
MWVVTRRQLSQHASVLSSRRLTVALVATALALSGVASAEAAAPTTKERNLLRAVNEARAAHGLVRVRFRWPLQARAHRYARTLLATNTFVHAHLPLGVGEDLAYGNVWLMRARQVVRLWLNSPPHRRILLWRAARRAGVGVADGRYLGFNGMRVAVLRLRR